MIACYSMSLPKGSPPLLHRILQNLFNLAFISEGQDPTLLLTDALLAGCSNPRDKIFGLLGLLLHGLSQKVQPRYTKSVWQVYKKASLAYFEWSGSLDLLVLAGYSWVQDWSLRRGTLAWLGRSCSGSSTAKFAYVAPDTLRVTGVTFDTAEAAVGPLPEDYTAGGMV